LKLSERKVGNYVVYECLNLAGRKTTLWFHSAFLSRHYLATFRPWERQLGINRSTFGSIKSSLVSPNRVLLLGNYVPYKEYILSLSRLLISEMFLLEEVKSIACPKYRLSFLSVYTISSLILSFNIYFNSLQFCLTKI